MAGLMWNLCLALAGQTCLGFFPKFSWIGYFSFEIQILWICCSLRHHLREFQLPLLSLSTAFVRNPNPARNGSPAPVFWSLQPQVGLPAGNAGILMFAAAQVGRDCYFEGGWSCCWPGKCSLTSGEAAQHSAPEVGQVCCCHSHTLPLSAPLCPLSARLTFLLQQKLPVALCRAGRLSSAVLSGEWIN